MRFVDVVVSICFLMWSVDCHLLPKCITVSSYTRSSRNLLLIFNTIVLTVDGVLASEGWPTLPKVTRSL